MAILSRKTTLKLQSALSKKRQASDQQVKVVCMFKKMSDDYRKFFESTLIEAFDSTPIECQVLLYVSQFPNISVKGLANLSGEKSSNVQRAVDSLEEQGIIYLSLQGGPKTKATVNLTERGKAKVTSAKTIINEIYSTITGAIQSGFESGWDEDEDEDEEGFVDIDTFYKQYESYLKGSTKNG